MASQQLDEEAIFHVARDLSNPELRAAYLSQVCTGDQALRERVEALLKVQDEERSFLKSAAPTVAPTVDLGRPNEQVGATIGRYKLMEPLGEGGMGAVFVAQQDRPIRRKVALKLIKPGMDSKSVVARFEAERQALAMMDHPNIAKVLDAGTTDSGRPYFAMELVKGKPITEYCDCNRLTIPERLELFIQVCQAIQHAHQKGIIHRDIKPSNVLVTLHDGQPVPKVIDFGVAKALNARLTDKTIYTEHLQVVGTLLYMSPEQAELSGLDVDTRSDIYSLGVLLYELLTGTTPFEQSEFSRAGFDEQRRMILNQDPPRASVRLSSLGETATTIAGHRRTDAKRLDQLLRGDLDWIVLKTLEKDRVRRYGTANSLADDLARFLSDQPVEACPPSSAYRMRKFMRRNWAAIAVLGAVGLALSIGLVLFAWKAYQYERLSADRLELIAKLEKNNQELIVANANVTALNVKLSELYFKDALNAAMGGDPERATEVMRQATKSEILHPTQIKILEGQRHLYAGEMDDAFQRLKEAADDSGRDSLLAHAMLVTAYSLGGHPGKSSASYSTMVERIKDVELTTLESLFVGQAHYYHETMKGIRILESLEPSPLGLAILADAETHVASESGDIAKAREALHHVGVAKEFLSESAYVQMVDLWAHQTALKLAAPDSPERKKWLKEAAETAETLARFPKYSSGRINRVIFFESFDELERAYKEVEKSLPLGQVHQLWFDMLTFSCDYDRRERTQQLLSRPQVKDWESNEWYALSTAECLAYSREGGEFILDVYELTSKHSEMEKWFNPASLLLIQLDNDARRQICKRKLQTEPDRWQKTVLQFVGEEGVDESELLDVADEEYAFRRVRRSHAHMLIAKMRLLNHNVEGARKAFEECSEINRVVESTIARAYINRIDHDEFADGGTDR